MGVRIKNLLVDQPIIMNLLLRHPVAAPLRIRGTVEQHLHEADIKAAVHPQRTEIKIGKAGLNLIGDGIQSGFLLQIRSHRGNRAFYRYYQFQILDNPVVKSTPV